MTRAGRTILLFGGVTLAVACRVAEPESLGVQPAIVFTSAPDYEDILADVNQIRLRVIKSSGMARDTVVPANVAPGRIRARVVLRPDEGAPGTQVDVTMTDGDEPLFAATILLDSPRGWLDETHVELVPVADFELGLSWILRLGESGALRDLTPVRFYDGRLRGARDVAWTSTRASIFEVVGDQLVPRAEGFASLIGVWHGQTDTLAIEVVPAEVELRRWNPLCFLGDSVAHYLGSENAAGVTACVDLASRAWTDGNARRVVLEIRNRHGSLGGVLDTAVQFDVRGFGISVDRPLDPSPELVEVAPVGPVRVGGMPLFTLTPNSTVSVSGVDNDSRSAITGCAPSLLRGPVFETCEPAGFTGVVRAEFRVADTDWMLSAAQATFSVGIPHVGVGCITPQPWCVVVPRGGR